jgi:hypothetical protein
MIDPEIVAEIITLALAIVSIFLGFRYGKLKHKLSIFRDLIDHLDEAWKDDKITDEELRMIIDDLLALKEEC